MKILRVHVKNFRSIADAFLKSENLTALVGPNGSGKSSFLRAIELFYESSPKISSDDYYDRDINNDIEVSITFNNLSEKAKEQFSLYLQDDLLAVSRVFSLKDGKLSSKYHGSRLLNPDFNKTRSAEKAGDKKTLYNELVGKQEYSDLPKWKNQTQALQDLSEWESQNPASLARCRDDGQFFGFKEVAQGYLGRYSRFIFIPAVRDASSDASEGKNSIFSDLMDLVVRSVLAEKEAVKSLKDETQKKFEEILNPENLTELKVLSAQLSETLKTFVPDANISLNWQSLEQVIIPLPKADIKLVEDDFESSVDKTGG